MSENRKRHTASFQLSKFLNSKDSLEYSELTGSSVSILRYMFDVMDMNYSQTGKEVCDKSIPQIACYSRTSDKTVRRSIPYFIEKKLLRLTNKEIGKSMLFSIGERIKTPVMVTQSYPQATSNPGHSDLSTPVMVTGHPGHGDLLVRTYSKNLCKTESKTLSDFFEPNEDNIRYASENNLDLEENVRTFNTKCKWAKTQPAFKEWLDQNIRHLKKPRVMATQQNEPFSAVNRMDFYQSPDTAKKVARDLAPPPETEVRIISDWRERLKEFKQQGSKLNGTHDGSGSTGNKGR